MPQTPAAARPDAFLSVAVFAIGVASTALGLMPPEIAFGGVVLVMALTGSLRLRSGRSEEHTSELQSLMRISYAVFCLKKKKHTEKQILGKPPQTSRLTWIYSEVQDVHC